MKRRTKLTALICAPIAILILLVSWPQYAAPRVFSEEKAIINNLRFIAFHSHIYMLENETTSVDFETLRNSDPTIEKTIKPHLGERYEDLNIKSTDTYTSTLTEDGTVISIEIETLDAFKQRNELPNKAG